MTLTTEPRRRDFLLATAAVLASPIGNAATAAGNAVKLVAGPQDLFRVRMTVEAKGNIHVPKNALVSRERHLKLPIQSEATFDYEERCLRPAGADANSVVTAAQRYYHQAESKSRVNRSDIQHQLRDSVRDTRIRRELLPETIYAVDDYFQRDELELLQVPVCSTGIDELLPSEALPAGATYQPSRNALASVLNLTSVEASDVQGKIASLTSRDAKIEFQGKLDGSVEGVPTVVRLVGKLTFDRAHRSCTWLAMAVHETREIGKAEPGFDIAATIKLRRQPLEQPMALSAQPADIDFGSGAPPERLFVDLRSQELGVSVLMDRRWRMMTDAPGTAMMRMIDNDRSIAQCDFRPLVKLEPGKQWSLEAFQADVRQTLGEQVTEMTEADEQTSPMGLRVLRVTARGAVENVPIEWQVLHFSDPDGRRVLATFTMEAENAAAFAGSDAQLATTLRLLPQTGEQPLEVAQDQGGDGSAAATGANQGDQAKRQVQSSGSPVFSNAPSTAPSTARDQAAETLR